MANRSPKDIGAIMADGRAVDRAVDAAYADAVRRHRAAGVPILVRRNGEAVLASAFDVRLPGEDERPAAG